MCTWGSNRRVRASLFLKNWDFSISPLWYSMSRYFRVLAAGSSKNSFYMNTQKYSHLSNYVYTCNENNKHSCTLEICSASGLTAGSMANILLTEGLKLIGTLVKADSVIRLIYRIYYIWDLGFYNNPKMLCKFFQNNLQHHTTYLFRIMLEA